MVDAADCFSGMTFLQSNATSVVRLLSDAREVSRSWMKKPVFI